MSRCNHILLHLAERLVHFYCPRACDAACLSKWDCRDHLIYAIAEKWKMDYRLLPSEETFYHTLRGKRKGSAMREKLALLYFAITDEQRAPEYIQRYLEIADRKQLRVTVYWNLFVQQYEEEQKQKTNRTKLPAQLNRWVENLSNADWNRLNKIMKKGRKKKVKKK